MKTLEEIFNSEPVFLNDWEGKTQDEIFDDFQLEQDKRTGIKILFASYGYANYSGDAFLIFTKDGKLFEVNGSHCSCNGLEHDWEPEETSINAIVIRLIRVEYFGLYEPCGNGFREELLVFLGITEDKDKNNTMENNVSSIEQIKKRFTGHSDVLSQLAFLSVNGGD